MEKLNSEELKLKAAWTALQVADKQQEKRGLDFGRACYELREKSEGVQGGTSFRPTLERLGIPHSTAYFWIARYEESVGERPPKIEPQVADVVQVERSTSSREMAYQDDPSAPIFSKTTELQKLNYRIEGIIEALSQLVSMKKWKSNPDYSTVKQTVKKLITIARRV